MAAKRFGIGFRFFPQGARKTLEDAPARWQRTPAEQPTIMQAQSGVKILRRLCDRKLSFRN